MLYIGWSFKRSCWSCWNYIFKSSPGRASYGNLTKDFCLKVILGHLVRLELFSDICFLTCLMWRCGAWHCFDIRAEEFLHNTCWPLTVPLNYLYVFKIQCYSKIRLYFLVKSTLWFKKYLHHTINLTTFAIHPHGLLKLYTRLILKVSSSLEKKFTDVLYAYFQITLLKKGLCYYF